MNVNFITFVHTSAFLPDAGRVHRHHRGVRSRMYSLHFCTRVSAVVVAEAADCLHDLQTLPHVDPGLEQATQTDTLPHTVDAVAAEQ